MVVETWSSPSAGSKHEKLKLPRRLHSFPGYALDILGILP
jgi:hypothetical protein